MTVVGLWSGCTRSVWAWVSWLAPSSSRPANASSVSRPLQAANVGVFKVILVVVMAILTALSVNRDEQQAAYCSETSISTSPVPPGSAVIALPRIAP